MKETFTDEEKKIMRKHNVPEMLAYQRYRIDGWEKERAITTPLTKGKNKKKEQY